MRPPAKPPAPFLEPFLEPPLEQQGDLFATPQAETLNVTDGQLIHHKQFITQTESTHLLTLWLKNIPWQQDHITIANKRIPIPRLQAWFGDKDSVYSYSGITLNPLPWTPELLQIKQKIEAASETSFNSLLINLYRTESDSVSWHADDESELGKDPIIASFSLGETRPFQLKHKTLRQRITLPLEHGDLLIMRGALQHHWAHQIPKTSHPLAPRINLTFRKIIR